MFYRKIIVLFAVIFLLSGCKENFRLLLIDIGLWNWAPISMSEPSVFYDKYYTSSSGKTWVRLTWLAERAILQNDIQLPFMDDGFLIAEISYDKKEIIKVDKVRTNALSIEDKVNFENSLNQSLKIFITSKNNLPEKLPKRFNINIPIASKTAASEARATLIDMMFKRCIEPISSGEVADTADMSELWEEDWLRDVNQIKWSDKSFPIHLTVLERSYQQSVYNGCSVHDPYDDWFSYFKKGDFRKIWALWVDEQLKNGKIITLNGCDDNMQKYRFNEKTPQGLYTYVAFFEYADQGGDFFISMADKEKQINCKG
ncbi:hypothetical protein [Curvivirga aplysinae]|uniref:hypothetical protein n=1 Tax=Curvivirga aplysinae TaxID=2529852 RepID=UPI0012BC0537|nr:hypothetical protein [Curvivirga aplysinae]MTI11279.1 hypothetical protein [Curvivirga aplysinae]